MKSPVCICSDFNNIIHIICYTLNMMEDDFFQIITNGCFPICHSHKIIMCIWIVPCIIAAYDMEISPFSIDFLSQLAAL